MMTLQCRELTSIHLSSRIVSFLTFSDDDEEEDSYNRRSYSI